MSSIELVDSPLNDVEVGVWYKHRGNFAFIYIYKKEQTYDYKNWIANYVWLGEMKNNDGTKSIFAETSEFTTGSEFHRSLYKITRPNLIPPPDIMAKLLLILNCKDGYTVIYPGQRKPGQIHPWSARKE